MKIIKSNAKVNLSLYIGEKYEDGYHAISTIMHEIPLFDILTFTPNNKEFFRKEHIENNIKLSCNIKYIPIDERNLVYKAIKLIFDKFSIKDSIKVHIHKNIPTGGGLGGGSSNAANTLLFLNEYYKLSLSLSELSNLAITIGSDVPFFLYGGTCLVKGKGEIIVPLKNIKNLKIKTVTPKINISTKTIYDAYDEMLLNINNIPKYKNIFLEKEKKLIDAINNDNIDSIKENIFNEFEPIVFEKFPLVKEKRDKLMKEGHKFVFLSGSGSSLFYIK